MITPFSAGRYLHPFRRYLRSKCELSQNRAKFWTVFALPHSKGGSPPKNCIQVIMPASQPVTWKSFVRLLPWAPEFLRLICRILSHFLNDPCKKLLGGPPSPMVCARKSWSFSSACKNFSRQRPLGAEIRSSEKNRF